MSKDLWDFIGGLLAVLFVLFAISGAIDTYHANPTPTGYECDPWLDRHACKWEHTW